MNATEEQTKALAVASQKPADALIDEKAVGNEIEYGSKGPVYSMGLTAAEKELEKKLKRKIDARWLVLTLIYILNYIDRNAMPAARLKGFQKDTGLTGDQYELAISIFFVGYIVMQVPSNFLLNYISRPSWFLGGATALWGVVSLCGGFVDSYGSVFAVRFLLGFVEAPFFPGALFCLSRWYTKRELAKRQVLIYVAASISSAISGLLAAGILSGMEGVAGHAGWRWLFWLEGMVTVCVGILAALVLPDWPSTSKFLSEEERALAIKRLAIEVGESDEESASFLTSCKQCFTDYKVWLFCLAMYCHNTSFSFTSYFPTIVKTLGYGSTRTLLLTAPPWFFSAILILVWAWLSDRSGKRYIWIMASLVLTFPGFIILLATKQHPIAPRYVSMFLMLASHAGYILMFSWLSSTIPRPSSKRAVAFAWVNSIGQLGQITGGYLFPEEWEPDYKQSWAILLAMSAAACLFYTIIFFDLRRCNAKMDKLQRESTETIDGNNALQGNKLAWRYAM